jgi:hypothetical protein
MVDKRMGTHAIQINYLSASGAVLPQSNRRLLEIGKSPQATWTGLREP